MSSRRHARRAATLLAAYVGAALGCLVGAGPLVDRAAAATPAPSLQLVSQTPWVTPTGTADGTFSLTVSVADPPPTAELGVYVFSALLGRTSFEADATRKTGPRGVVLTQVTPVPLSQLTADPDHPGALQLAIAVATSYRGVPAQGHYVNLQCAGTAHRTCTGVYPVRVSLFSPTTTSPLQSFTTFLTYVRAAGTRTRVDFAWVLPVSTPTTLAAAMRGAQALPDPKAAALETLAGQLDGAATVPVTVEASPRTLRALTHDGSAGKAAVSSLAELSRGGIDQFPAQPLVPIDLQTMGDAGQSAQIAAQMKAGKAAFASEGVQTTPATAWVGAGAGQALFSGLAQLEVHQVVLPEKDFSTVEQRTTDTTFPLRAGAKATTTPATLVAADADADIATELAPSPNGPALNAYRLLADLAMIYFEEPNTPAQRGMVGVAPATGRPTATSDGILLSALAGDPVVAPVTLSTFFTKVTDTGKGPTLNTGASTASATLSKSASGQLHQALTYLAAFRRAVDTNAQPPAIVAQLRRILLCSEATAGLSSKAADHWVHDGTGMFKRGLDSQLSHVGFANDQEITLTARTGVIPITLVRSLPYVLRGRLTVTSSKFEFPQGNSKPVVLDHTSNPTSFNVVARSSGEQALQITFTTPTGKLLIKTTPLTVRSTATSVVGIILTGVALAVLLLWWARTWRSGRRARKLRPAGPTVAE